MKLSTTAALFALAAAQGANAVDFDFRDFEGLWEGPGSADTDGTLATVTCGATGDFRKAMCELEAITENFSGCGGDTAVFEGKWILDQFDAEAGTMDEIMLSLKCCSTTGCTDPVDAELQATMLAGKSNKYVRAIDVTITSENDEFNGQLRKTAGGFKSYD